MSVRSGVSVRAGRSRGQRHRARPNGTRAEKVHRMAPRNLRARDDAKAPSGRQCMQWEDEFSLFAWHPSCWARSPCCLSTPCPEVTGRQSPGLTWSSPVPCSTLATTANRHGGQCTGSLVQGGPRQLLPQPGLVARMHSETSADDLELDVLRRPRPPPAVRKSTC